MKRFTCIAFFLFAFMGCTEKDIVPNQQDLTAQKITQDRPLELLFLVDGIEIKNRKELQALDREKYRMTVHPKNSAFGIKFGDRVKYGVVVMTSIP